MTSDADKFEHLLGTVDALKEAIFHIASEMSKHAQYGIASEMDVYGGRREVSASSSARAAGQRDAAYEIALKLWPTAGRQDDQALSPL